MQPSAANFADFEKQIFHTKWLKVSFEINTNLLALGGWTKGSW